MIIASAPLRISFASSDHEPFSSRFSGAALNLGITKRVYILIRKRNSLEETKYRIAYSKTELCDVVDDIDLCVVREAIKMSGIEDPLEIIYSSDMAKQMGLGTSTAMITALLKGLYYYNNIGISNELLFDHVYRLERQICNHAGGFQDGVPAIWGGINYIEGSPHNVKRTPVTLSIKQAEQLARHMMLIYTGNTGDSSEALKDQLALLECGETLGHTMRIKTLVEEMYGLLCHSDFHPMQLLGSIKESWELKKKLSPTMTNSTTDYIENAIKNITNDAAVRLVGGGAGRGLFLCLATPAMLRYTQGELNEFKTIPVEMDWDGVSVRKIF